MTSAWTEYLARSWSWLVPRSRRIIETPAKRETVQRPQSRRRKACVQRILKLLYLCERCIGIYWNCHAAEYTQRAAEYVAGRHVKCGGAWVRDGNGTMTTGTRLTMSTSGDVLSHWAVLTYYTPPTTSIGLMRHCPRCVPAEDYTRSLALLYPCKVLT